MSIEIRSTCQSILSTPAFTERPARWLAHVLLPAALLVLATAGLPAQSQYSSQLRPLVQSAPSSRPALDLRSYLTAPLNLSAPAGSSSSSLADDPAAARFSLSAKDAGGQPPPRRSYGRRPRYSDNSHNADGSNKYTFEFGAGLTLPTPDTSKTFTPSYKFQVGAGRNFSKTFGLIAQFDWDNFGIQSATLNQLLVTYQTLCGLGCTGTRIQQIGGSTHAWSLSVNPVITVAQSEKSGVYLVGGAGFYHKATNITTPTIGTYCDYYYGCYQYQANSSIDKYTSNAPGINGGLGLTYRASRFNDLKFFVEARYVYTFNDPRPYYDGTTGTKISPTYLNLFPQNSQRTSYVPITFGVRF